MNYKMIFNTLGKVLKIESMLLVLPIIASLCYQEWNICLFIGLSAIISLILGFLLTLTIKPKTTAIYAKEGFITVAFSWIAVSVISALPFTLSGEIPSFIDALFETVSGFTTTGATILTRPENLSHGLLFLRSFNHFIGGMGILVFVMAIIPQSNDKTIHVLRAEMPGPVVDKIVPRSKNTAKILYIIYIGMTALLAILLLCGGMNLFDSITHAFATAGTGGFSNYSTSIANENAYIQWVVAIFMLLYGVNFNIYFLILIGKFKNAIKSKELLTYFLIVIVSIIIIALNIYPLFNNLNDTIRHSVFQVSSIISTTGFTTQNINEWNSFAKFTLLILMFIGGCAGSTAGGLKVFRVSILFKRISYELKRLIHPNTVEVMTFDGKKIDEQTVNGVTSYFALYIVFILLTALLISVDGLSIETNITSAISCFNNIGPAFGSSATDYTCYSGFSKIILTFAMLLGRLEIYPLLLALSPYTWLKK